MSLLRDIFIQSIVLYCMSLFEEFIVHIYIIDHNIYYEKDLLFHFFPC